MGKVGTTAKAENRIGWLSAWEPNLWGRGTERRKYRKEVLSAGITRDVETLRAGNVPTGFPWLEKVVSLELGASSPSMPTRLMAVIEELARAQDADPRDLAYEQRVRVMGKVLTDTMDCDLNLLGFCAQVQTADGEVHEAYYGGFRLGEDGKWDVLVQGQSIPVSRVQAIVPWPSPDER